MEPSDFVQLAEKEINEIYDILEKSNFPEDFDLISDVLYIYTAKGDYVINQHSPTKQIWLSSPVSNAGYFNYDSETGKWKDKHNRFLRQVLAKDLEHKLLEN